MPLILRLLTSLFCLAALPAFAACTGSDLRPSLTTAEQRQLDTLLADQPYPSGNHWRARRGDKVLNLVGTMHLDDPRFDAVMPRLMPLVETASMVLLELTAREEAELEAQMARDPSLLVLQDTSLPDLMGDDWEALAAAVKARGVPPFLAAKFQPWYVSVLLAVPTCMPVESLTTGGLDDRIENAADALGIPTRALEPYDTVFRAFEAVPLSQQTAMLRSALLPDAAADDLFATLLEAYFDESQAETWALSQVLAARFDTLSDSEADAVFALMNDTLLIHRNRAWIPALLQALEDSNGPVLAAFGAAHLGGTDGVLALLEAEGFSLERLPF